MLSLYTLWRRELVRFIRQPNRVFGALGQPLLFWLIVGAGFEALQVNYIEYFFPGILLMILLFTAIFSTFSVIEDRKEGFLQGVLVSPAPRWAIVLGKVFGGATLATFQALLFCAMIPFLGIKVTLLSFCLLVAILCLVAVSLTAFGLCLAWRMDSIQGFHALMMLILLPMWFLSGAFFPLEGVHWGLRWLMTLNPVTYGLAAIRELLYWNGSLNIDNILIIFMFGLISLLFSWRLVCKKRI